MAERKATVFMTLYGVVDIVTVVPVAAGLAFSGFSASGCPAGLAKCGFESFWFGLSFLRFVHLRDLPRLAARMVIPRDREV